MTRVVQAPGEYVITFPRAYHGGFSNGFCIGEAVNFSIGDWFPFGLDAAQRYRRLSRLPILAHDELLCLEGLAIHGKVLLLHSASVHVDVVFHVYDMCLADNNGKLLSICIHRKSADALQCFADRLVSVLLPFCCFPTAKHQQACSGDTCWPMHAVHIACGSHHVHWPDQPSLAMYMLPAMHLALLTALHCSKWLPRVCFCPPDL